MVRVRGGNGGGVAPCGLARGRERDVGFVFDEEVVEGFEVVEGGGGSEVEDGGEGVSEDEVVVCAGGVLERGEGEESRKEVQVIPPGELLRVVVDGAGEVGLGEEHSVEPVNAALVPAAPSVPCPPHSHPEGAPSPNSRSPQIIQRRDPLRRQLVDLLVQRIGALRAPSAAAGRSTPGRTPETPGGSARKVTPPRRVAARKHALARRARGRAGGGGAQIQVHGGGVGDGRAPFLGRRRAREGEVAADGGAGARGREFVGGGDGGGVGEDAFGDEGGGGGEGGFALVVHCRRGGGGEEVRR